MLRLMLMQRIYTELFLAAKRSSIIYGFNSGLMQGRRLKGRDRGIVPLKKVGGGDGGAFIPQYLENVLQIYNVKKDKNERERR